VGETSIPVGDLRANPLVGILSKFLTITDKIPKQETILIGLVLAIQVAAAIPLVSPFLHGPGLMTRDMYGPATIDTSLIPSTFK